MADWWQGLWGKKPAAKVPAKTPAPPKGRTPVAESDRAKLIAQALATHRVQGAVLRAALDRTIADLERAKEKLLRDPDGLDRLLSLVRARRMLRALLGSDLRRYLVLTGLRQWQEEGRGPSPTVNEPGRPRRSRVVRR